jgi:hypothetical protein
VNITFIKKSERWKKFQKCENLKNHFVLTITFKGQNSKNPIYSLFWKYGVLSKAQSEKTFPNTTYPNIAYPKVTNNLTYSNITYPNIV